MSELKSTCKSIISMAFTHFMSTLTLECPGGAMGNPIGFSDLKFEAFKQSK